jgi:hypothetical protein
MSRRRFRSLIAFAVLVAVLLGASFYLRNFLLHQVDTRIQSIVHYSSLHLRLFPPSLIIEDVRTISTTPFFSARRVLLQLPLSSLLKSEKPLTVVIDQPVVRFSPGPPPAEKPRKPRSSFSLPFALAKGIVRNGEIYYLSGEESLSIQGLNALLQPKGDSYALLVEADQTTFWLGDSPQPLEGKLSLLVQAGRQQVNVRKLVLNGPQARIRAKGEFTGFPKLEGSLQISYRARMDAVAGILRIPFNWQGRVEGMGALTRSQKTLSYRTSFSSDDLILNRIPLEKASGRVEILPGQGVTMNMNILRETGNEAVEIRYARGLVRGQLQGFHLDPIFSYVDLPYPLRSPIWGNFSVDDRALVADFEFREEDLSSAQSGKYPLRGPCHFNWDLRSGVTFSSPQLETNFGRLEVNGEIAIGRRFDISITGEVSDVKAGREFTALVLGEPLDFPEIRGRGRSVIRISGGFPSPDVKIDFDLAPAGFDQFDVAASTGTVSIIQKTVQGHFLISDPEIKAEIDLLSRSDGLNASIHMSEGELTRVLPGLSLPYAFSGKASGNFEVIEKGKSLRVEGAFSSQLLKFESEDFSNVTGKLTWDGDFISFPELAFDYYGGRVKGSWRLGTVSQSMEIDMTAVDINLHSLTPSLFGKLSLGIKGQGRPGEDVGSGRFQVKGVVLDPFQPADAEGDLRLQLWLDRLHLNVKGRFLPGENDFTVDAAIPFTRDPLAIDIKGGFANLDLLLPWKGAKGQLNYVAEVRGMPASPQVNGVVDFQGPVLPFPQFAQAVTDYTGYLFIKNFDISVRSIKGKLGGGEIQGGGNVLLKSSGLPDINLSFQGKGLQLSPFERTRSLADVSLRLMRDEKRFVLDGNIDVRRVLWRREVYEKLIFASTRYPQAQQKPGFFDDLTLNLRLRAEDNAWMENSLGRLRGRFDLTVTGNIRDPIVLGTIEALSGEVYFQDRKFQILKGRLSFFNPSTTEPYIEGQAETYVKDYRVTVTLSGLVSQLRPEFSSSPPLPPEDVLALLALGEAFKRPYRTEASTQLSSASLVSFQLTEEAQKRVERLFSLDRIRIDPFLMGSSAEMTARLTVGKRISSNFFIYYSTNLTRQTEEIMRFDWDLRNEFSIVGTRNEFGRVSLDFKIRRRF